jgi:cyclase
MEDTVTYVDEPQQFEAHLTNLTGLSRLDPDRILPNHGDPEIISDGGYTGELIAATEQYIRMLQRCRTEPDLREMSLRELIREPLDAGVLHYFAPYEAVHRRNVSTVLASGSG